MRLYFSDIQSLWRERRQQIRCKMDDTAQFVLQVFSQFFIRLSACGQKGCSPFGKRNSEEIKPTQISKAMVWAQLSVQSEGTNQTLYPPPPSPPPAAHSATHCSHCGGMSPHKTSHLARRVVGVRGRGVGRNVRGEGEGVVRRGAGFGGGEQFSPSLNC